MSQHCDEILSDCYVVIDSEHYHRLEEIRISLEADGVKINSFDMEKGIIECTGRDAVIAKLPGQIRRVFTYIADYPPGDKRDLDGIEEALETDE